jgi:hypothetical protein
MTILELKVGGLSQGTNRKTIEFYIDGNGCFICTSHNVHHSGYPQIFHNGRVTSITRMIMETRYGRKLEREISVIHNCDNKLCINPDHIRVGTQQDNMIDCRNKMRITGQKLSDSDVESVRELYKTGNFSQRILGTRFGVGQDQISRIVNFKRWR